MLGIPDPQVLLAYVLSILSTLFCIAYSVKNWNTGDEAIYPEDTQWVKDEKEAEQNI